MFSLNLLYVILVIYALWRFGVLVTLAMIVESFLIFGPSTYLAPSPTSPFYARLTFGFLARRAANYARNNDYMRADAAMAFASKIAELFADDLVR
jgi:hypothetical protein